MKRTFRNLIRVIGLSMIAIGSILALVSPLALLENIGIGISPQHDTSWVSKTLLLGVFTALIGLSIIAIVNRLSKKQ